MCTILCHFVTSLFFYCSPSRKCVTFLFTVVSDSCHHFWWIFSKLLSYRTVSLFLSLWFKITLLWCCHVKSLKKVPRHIFYPSMFYSICIRHTLISLRTYCLLNAHGKPALRCPAAVFILPVIWNLEDNPSSDMKAYVVSGCVRRLMEFGKQGRASAPLWKPAQESRSTNYASFCEIWGFLRLAGITLLRILQKKPTCSPAVSAESACSLCFFF